MAKAARGTRIILGIAVVGALVGVGYWLLRRRGAPAAREGGELPYVPGSILPSVSPEPELAPEPYPTPPAPPVPSAPTAPTPTAPTAPTAPPSPSLPRRWARTPDYAFLPLAVIPPTAKPRAITPRTEEEARLVFPPELIVPGRPTQLVPTPLGAEYQIVTPPRPQRVKGVVSGAGRIVAGEAWVAKTEEIEALIKSPPSIRPAPSSKRASIAPTPSQAAKDLRGLEKLPGITPTWV